MAAARPAGPNIALFDGKTTQQIKQKLDEVKAETAAAHALALDLITQLKPILEVDGKGVADGSSAVAKLQQVVPLYTNFYSGFEQRLNDMIAKEDLQTEKVACATLVHEASKVHLLKQQLSQFKQTFEYHLRALADLNKNRQ